MGIGIIMMGTGIISISYTMLQERFTNRNLSYEEKITWMQIALTEGIGFIRFTNLMNMFSDDLFAILNYITKDTLERKQKIKVIDRFKIEQIFEKAQTVGAEILLLPDLFQQAPIFKFATRPPLFLIAKGNLALLKEISISIVGARDASQYNERFTASIANALSRDEGYVITSGLARGIDTAAHCGAFPSTIGVIGNGIDYIYPQENEYLYNKISCEGGLLISEYPFGSPPLPKHFYQRNRIIALLSMATIVVEAARRSGSIITAEFALEAGREVCACPGLPDNSRYLGSNMLIQNGAYLVHNAHMLIEYLADVKEKYLKREQLSKM